MDSVFYTLCPTLATFINNCYSKPSDLFVQGGKLLKSLEGTTQGDPAAMAIYALGITPLLAWLSNLSNEKREKFPLRQVAQVDDQCRLIGKLEEMVGFITTRRLEIRLSRKSFKITHNC